MNENLIHSGDSLEILKSFPDESINCVITSPPYWGLRDYGMDAQLGLEKSPEEYVKNLVSIFHEIKRVLKNDGTLWLNLGDSYAGSWGNYSGQNRGVGRQREIKNGSTVPNPAYDGAENWRPPTSGKMENGIKNKDLVGIPWMVAFALRADGWYLRQDIVWSKPNPMPESVTDRCTKSHEYIFLMSKSAKYFYDAQAIAEPLAPSSVSRLAQKNLANQEGSNRVPGKKGNMKAVARAMPRYGMSSNTPDLNQFLTGTTRNKRSVWNVSTRPFKEAHFATFPEELIVPMIKAGCPIGGVVLDPFIGAGTTGLVAKKLGRKYIGIELNPAYIEIAEKRIKSILI